MLHSVIRHNRFYYDTNSTYLITLNMVSFFSLQLRGSKNTIYIILPDIVLCCSLLNFFTYFSDHLIPFYVYRLGPSQRRLAPYMIPTKYKIASACFSMNSHYLIVGFESGVIQVI